MPAPYLAASIVGYLLMGLSSSWMYYRHRWNKIVLLKQYRHPYMPILGHSTDNCDRCMIDGSRISPLEQWARHIDGTAGKAFGTLLIWPAVGLYWILVTLSLVPGALLIRMGRGLDHFWNLGLKKPETEETPAKLEKAA